MAVVISNGVPKPKKKRRALHIAAAAVLLCLAVFSGWRVWLYWQDYRGSSDEYDRLANAYTRVDIDKAGGWHPVEPSEHEPEEPVDPRVPGVAGVDFPDLGVDHASLDLINGDYIGWLHMDDDISDVHISYPFLQGETNDTYLRTTMEGESKTAGSIFVDSNTPADFSEHHTILYGHNMLDGSMFSDLKKYLGTAELEQVRYFYIYLKDGSVLKCRLFSAHVVPKTSTVYQIDMSDRLYQEFFPRVLGESDDDWGCSGLVPDDIPEKTVTLSTCYGRAGTTKRMVVHGYIDTWYVDPAAILPAQGPDAGGNANMAGNEGNVDISGDTEHDVEIED